MPISSIFRRQRSRKDESQNASSRAEENSKCIPKTDSKNANNNGTCVRAELSDKQEDEGIQLSVPVIPCVSPEAKDHVEEQPVTSEDVSTADTMSHDTIVAANDVDTMSHDTIVAANDGQEKKRTHRERSVSESTETGEHKINVPGTRWSNATAAGSGRSYSVSLPCETSLLADKPTPVTELIEETIPLKCSNEHVADILGNSDKPTVEPETKSENSDEIAENAALDESIIKNDSDVAEETSDTVAICEPTTATDMCRASEQSSEEDSSKEDVKDSCSIDEDEEGNEKEAVASGCQQQEIISNLPPEMAKVVERLCLFVDETVKNEIYNAALAISSGNDMIQDKAPDSSTRSTSVSSDTTETTSSKPVPMEEDTKGHEIKSTEELGNESAEVSISDKEKSAEDECCLPAHSAEEDLLLENSSKVSVRVYDDGCRSARNSISPMDDLDISPKQQRIDIETFDTISTTSSFVSETDDQGVHIPAPQFPSQTPSNSHNWKVGYLQVKIPHKARGRAKLKVWQKKMVVVQPDEFEEDEKNRSLILSVYQSESTSSRRHNATFWRSVCSKTTVLYRSMSRTHPYAFTVADDQGPVIHLSADSETATQEWMAAIRNILWPPSSMMQLEKAITAIIPVPVLNGNEFEVAVIDNDFAYRAGLLGTYGYLAVSGKKLSLLHPQTGHVIQEWYLNTVDRFQLLPMPKEEDAKKVLVMHTSSESSTGRGEIKFFCPEAVAFLQSIASTIHKVLQYHSQETKERYKKELEEIAQWLTPQPSSPGPARQIQEEDHYKVPPRQVRSLLDIPNFVFDKGTQNAFLNDGSSQQAEPSGPKLTSSSTCVSTFSEDSGISVAPDDFLNCSVTSFTIGNGSLRAQDRTSSGSELSDCYSPPVTPDTIRKVVEPESAPKVDCEPNKPVRVDVQDAK